MVTNAVDLPPGLRWHTPRAVLIGDAAHAASPATGQGASMALEDAVILAKALRDAPTPAAAFADYDRLRRPRVETNIASSAALSAGRPPAKPQTPPLTAEELIGQLSWTTPLPSGTRSQ
ncbi:2-polyprenyl-6-methoxyphenol hydroxylase-like FAD-dependent oxidoreductase [Catenulispora sp. MAP5-51]|uniref:FAD-dependent oxidoreductase n=1 Tax=Catenulispora sp. MAP5-51 TaxID=3156298 RepID=UPI0035154DE0